MTTSDGRDNHDLVAALHRAHEDVTSRQLSLLEIVARCDDEELWRKDGPGTRRSGSPPTSAFRTGPPVAG
jgi:hypothetical protein